MGGDYSVSIYADDFSRDGAMGFQKLCHKSNNNSSIDDAASRITLRVVQENEELRNKNKQLESRIKFLEKENSRLKRENKKLKEIKQVFQFI